MSFRNKRESYQNDMYNDGFDDDFADDPFSEDLEAYQGPGQSLDRYTNNVSPAVTTQEPGMYWGDNSLSLADDFEGDYVDDDYEDQSFGRSSSQHDSTVAGAKNMGRLRQKYDYATPTGRRNVANTAVTVGSLVVGGWLANKGFDTLYLGDADITFVDPSKGIDAFDAPVAIVRGVYGFFSKLF